MYLKESKWKKEEGLLLLVLDSTGIETDRYDYKEQPVKKTKKFEHRLVPFVLIKKNNFGNFKSNYICFKITEIIFFY